MIRVTQQRIRCIGCNACVEAAPGRWRISTKDGRCTLIGGTEKKGFFSALLPDEELEENLKAAANCPVNIIHIVQLCR